MPPKIVITGASGFIGVKLVPRLTTAGCELLLVGRNPAILDNLFPCIPNCKYEEIPEKASDFDALVHLAVLNNNAQEDTESFNRVNVEFLLEVLSSAKSAHIDRFVNVTTFHATANICSAYAESKRNVLYILEKEKDISVINVFLPAVYGQDFSGQLAVLEKFPALIRPATLVCFTAFVPTLHIDKLSAFVAAGIDSAPREVILANPQDQNPVYRAGKRLIDILFSAAVIFFFGWFLMIVWGFVRLGSSGPGIFAQKRVGQNGKLFTCYKFRTMETATKQAGTHEVTPDAVTKFGAFLRKTKIDELPQVWNIVRGELSLVGPRPCLPVQKDVIMHREQRGVLRALPGITGLAQINGVDMSDPVRLAKIDARYVAQRGLLLELKIIIATLLGRGQGDKVHSSLRSDAPNPPGGG